MRTALLLLCLAALLAVCGCLERTEQRDSDPAAAGGWQLAGQFGGHAKVISPSDDPLLVRYTPGTFKLVSGLDVTDGEVWVCDLDLSRIQVFSYDGRLLRSIGSGVDASLALPTEEEHYLEAANFNRREDVRWETQFGAPWYGSERTHFRAADIVVLSDGYWLADQTRTCGLRDPLRAPAVYFVPDEGELTRLNIGLLVWPSHLAATVNAIAVADYRSNHLALCNLTNNPVDVNYLQRGGNFNNMMALETSFRDNPQYMAQHFRFAAGNQSVGGTYLPGGMALAFGKLIACDTLNQRIQLYEARIGNSNWGRAIREIRAVDQQGNRRFQVPLDIEVASDGTMLVCDSAAAEVVVMDATFKRIAAFGRRELVEPYALAVSPDGAHCFVTDRRSNMVYHYAHAQ